MKCKEIFVFCLLSLFFFSLFTCKRQNYIPQKNNAYLAALNFSEGLRLKEKFNSRVFEYNMEVSTSIKGFFVICVPDNPNSTFKISIEGIELPIPFVLLNPLLPVFDLSIVVISPDGTTQTYTVHITTI